MATKGALNGNLDGGNSGSTNYFALYDVQNRRVIRPNQGSAVFNGVVTDHYELYNSVTNYLRPGATSVFMPTEMLHGLYDGGIGACLSEIWNAFRNSSNGGGMFLWAFLDEGITNASLGGMDVKGQSAPDGVVGPYRQGSQRILRVQIYFQSHSNRRHLIRLHVFRGAGAFPIVLILPISINVSSDGSSAGLRIPLIQQIISPRMRSLVD